MKAIHVTQGGGPSVLQLVDLPKPSLSDAPTSILVKVKAVSVNPVDTKIRKGASAAGKVLGFDCAGVVEEVGSQTNLFKVGDEVISSAVLGKFGTNAEYFAIDESLVAHKPKGWSFADGAALPLVAITAWDLMHISFGIQPSDTVQDGSILIVNGAGGVGTIATQLASKVFKLKEVIVTASRPETIEWVKKQGATKIINHHKGIVEELGDTKVNYAMLLHSTPPYVDPVSKVMRSRGKIGSIVETDDPIPFQNGFGKCLSFHWEFMLHKSDDPNAETQGQILAYFTDLADKGIITPIATRSLPLTLKNLQEVHAELEAGKGIGKIVLTTDAGAWS